MRPGWTFAVFVAIALVPWLPAASAQEAPLWKQDDARGDVSPGLFVLPNLPAGPPANPGTNHVDIVSLEIAKEDEVSIEVVIRLDRLRLGSIGAGGSGFYAGLNFRIGEVSYWADAYLVGALTTDAEATFVASRVEYSGLWACGRQCTDQPADAILAENAIRFVLPKLSLIGANDYGGDERIEGMPASIGPGTRIEGLRARTASGFLLADISDETSREAPPYAVKVGMANQAIRLVLPQAWDGLAVQNGLNQTLPFIIENRAGAKRLLTMDYLLQGPADRVKNYRVAGPASLTLAAGAVRNFTLALDAAASSSPDDGVQLVLRARSLGHPEELGHAQAKLVPGPAMSPSQSTLHFQGQRRAVAGQPADEAICAQSLYGFCGRGFLSLHEKDPAAHEGTNVQAGRGFSPDGGRQFYFLRTLAGTASPVAMDPKGVIEANLNLRSQATVQGVRLTVDVVYDSPDAGGALMRAIGTANVGPTPSTVKLSGPIELPAEMAVLPRGTGFSITVVAEYPLGSGSEPGWAAGGIEIVPAGSSLTFPVVPLPEGVGGAATQNPFQVVAAAGLEEYVNPGKARRFNVTILHQGLQEERAEIRADSDWRVEVRPGAAYDLVPGDTVTVSVLAYAPADARENDHGKIRVQVLDSKGSNVSLALTAIVTNGLEFPDDAADQSIDEEASRKLVVQKPGGTPGFEAAGLLAAAAVLLRRRKA